MNNKTTRVLLTILVVGLAAMPALAQQVAPGDLSALTAATPAGDWSIRLWQSLLGDFAKNPFSQLGTPTTLLGAIFLTFNSCVFTAGFFWAMYGITSGVVQTAHEGEVLGKRMSTVWFPIRMITGIAGMVPIFGGFTVNQAIMMSLTVVGIGIGNSMWTTAVSHSGHPLVATQFTPTATAEVRGAVRDMFLANLCLVASNKLNQEAGGDSSEFVRVVAEADQESQTRQYRFGSENETRRCGYVGVQANAKGRQASDALAYRSGAVNYSAIEQAAGAAYVQGIGQLQAQIGPLAVKWHEDKLAANKSGAEPPRWPQAELDRAVEAFSAGIQAVIQKNTDGKAIEASARQNMLALGWFGAGAWHSTFAEVNAAVADAARGPQVKSKGPSQDSQFAGEPAEMLDAAQRAWRVSEARRSSGGTDGERAILDSAIKDSGCGVGNSLAGTATGNCSLGQGLVSAAIRGTAIGSGGGGNGSGSIGLDSTGFTGLVDPIAMMKNMGDYAMTVSTTILTLAVAQEVAESVAPASFVSRAFTLAGSAISKIGLGEKALGLIKSAAVVLLFVGMGMSIYIPLIPFIVWMGAILAYCASIIEGLAGASLHAMAHLDGDGEGMGQKTAHGYMFMLNALLRPGLMVIGFFAASGLMMALGTLQAQLFLPAMANAQGNSVTGLASIIGFLLLFLSLNYTLISACFHLIYVITDQTLGFLGGQIDSKLGRETEDKANLGFMAVSRGAKGGAGAAILKVADKEGGKGEKK